MKKEMPNIYNLRCNIYLGVMFILFSIISIFDVRFALPSSLIFAVLIYYNYNADKEAKKQMVKYIESLAFNTNTATKETLLGFPMPLVVMELDGTIIWYNTPFKELFEADEILNEDISQITKDIHPSNFIGDEWTTSKDVIISGKFYRACGNKVKVDNTSFGVDRELLFVYLVDNTDFIELLNSYNDDRPVIGVIVIDNYDDLMQSMDDNRRPQMISEISNKVVKSIDFTKGVVKKFERDKYILLFKVRYLKELENKKFDVLDSVKEINIGNKIPVTLSIGMGINGESFLENLQFANASIDIALGRGGDQAVVKNLEYISFFGGKTRELEKKTKVKARVISLALKGLIDQAPNVIIMGHANCDIDCLGASLGLYRMIKNRKKRVNIVLNSSNPTIDAMIAKISKIAEYGDVFIGRKIALEVTQKNTLLIVVDTHLTNFTECPDILEFTDQVVIIDHHRRSQGIIQNTILTYQETYASSACELVTEILQYVEEKIQLEQIEAEALYAGIIVDTKNFTFKTGVRTFEAAAFLRRQGVDTIAIKQMFQYDFNTYINIASVIKNLELMNGNIAISVCPSNIKNPQLIAAQSADQMLGLVGISAAFVLTNVNNAVSISGRSLGEINVQVILEKLGGGGHFTLAAAKIIGISMEVALEKLKKIILESVQIEEL